MIEEGQQLSQAPPPWKQDTGPRQAHCWRISCAHAPAQAVSFPSPVCFCQRLLCLRAGMQSDRYST